MKKDYLPVSVQDSSAGETDFIEKFWSDRWAGQDLGQRLAGGIESDERFAIVDPFLSRLGPGAKILDGGCGLGQWTVYYTNRGFEVYGLDISQAVVARLREQFPKVNFVAGDISRTEFEDSFFDAYFSWGTFEHLEAGPDAYFQEARRILKPDGLLMVSVPYQNKRHIRRDWRPLEKWDEAFNRKKGYDGPMRFFQWRFTRPELEREFERHGFKVELIKPVSAVTGLRRALKHGLGYQPGPWPGRLIDTFLLPIIPKNYIAHMILAVGRKRENR